MEEDGEAEELGDTPPATPRVLLLRALGAAAELLELGGGQRAEDLQRLLRRFARGGVRRARQLRDPLDERLAVGRRQADVLLDERILGRR